MDADTGRWLTIDEVISGQARLDNTLACDAELRLRKRKVLRVMRSGMKPVLRLRTALGHEIVATAEHPFMTLAGWLQLGKLKVGDTSGDGAFRTGAGLRCLLGQNCGDRGGREPRKHTICRSKAITIFWPIISLSTTRMPRASLSSSIPPPGSKHYEPAAFCAALINSQPMGFYAPAQLVRDARAHGVEVRAVDAMVSGWDCTLERRTDGRPALRLGLRSGEAFIERRGGAAVRRAHRACL